MHEQRPRVLVVDDDAGMRITLEGLIEDEGYDVVGVSSGYAAVELVRHTFFPLIFMDIKMPGINGVEAYREIKRLSPRSVVVMMTGFSIEELVKAALEEGAYAVLYKPLNVHQVVDILHSVLKTLCVLVVDDLPSHRAPLCSLLEEKGYQVSEAQNGNHAIEMARSQRYHVILMDIMLPDLDGFSAFEEIRRIDPLVKVVFVTGYALEDCPRKALLSGAYTVLSKPVNPEMLLELIQSLCSADPEAKVTSIM